MSRRFARLTKIALILFAVANVAATCQGTETGNPGVPSHNPGGGDAGGGTTGGTGGETSCLVVKKQASTEGDLVVDDLIAALCNKILLCGVATTTDACFNALNGADGDRFLDELGLPPDAYTVTTLRQALKDGGFAADAAAASSCEAAIGSTDCEAVLGNVFPPDFSGTERFVPLSCAAVFGSGDADGAPFPGTACP